MEEDLAASLRLCVRRTPAAPGVAAGVAVEIRVPADLRCVEEAVELMKNGGMTLGWAGHSPDAARLTLTAMGSYQLVEVQHAPGGGCRPLEELMLDADVIVEVLDVLHVRNGGAGVNVDGGRGVGGQGHRMRLRERQPGFQLRVGSGEIAQQHGMIGEIVMPERFLKIVACQLRKPDGLGVCLERAVQGRQGLSGRGRVELVGPKDRLWGKPIPGSWGLCYGA